MNVMAYVLETDVDRYGYLYGGRLPVDPVEHDWEKPYPSVEERLKFRWDRGELRRKPDVFHHNMLRDVVCNRRAYEVLAGDDLKVIARGSLDGDELLVVQAVTVLDVLDEERSLP